MVGGQRAGYAVRPDMGTKQLRGSPVTLAPLQDNQNFPIRMAAEIVVAGAAASSSSAAAMPAGPPLLAAPAPPAPFNSGDADAQMHGDSDGGRPKIRTLKSPMTPTPEEVEEHNTCHLPHRLP